MLRRKNRGSGRGVGRLNGLERRGEYKIVVEEVEVQQMRIAMEGKVKGKKDIRTHAVCGSSTNRQCAMEVVKWEWTRQALRNVFEIVINDSVRP